jgi:hypothetical protein
MSESLKKKWAATSHPMLGRTHTEESKKKMSESQKKIQQGENNHFYGKKHTEEAKYKMSIARSKRNKDVLA